MIIRSLQEIERLDRKVAIWLTALLGLCLALLVFTVSHPPAPIGFDFEAFWCAARGLLAHANPYLNEPLHTCEATAGPDLFRGLQRYLTIPAPLPPYGLAFFVPFAVLPLAWARATWWMILCVASLAVGQGIARLTGASMVTSTCASLLAVAGPSILQGSLSPVAIVMMVYGALALRDGRWNRAAILLGVAMIQPNTVLPAVIAVFIFVNQMRLRLLLVGAIEATVTLVAVGPHVALTYFTEMLPLHATSEVSNFGQYSLTIFLHQVGVPASASLHIAALQYGALALLGLVAARQLLRKTADRSWLVILPAGFAVVGGQYVHLGEVAMAVPLACMILMPRRSPVARIVLVMLAIPSEWVVYWPILSVPAALVVGWFMANSPYLRRTRFGGLPLIVLTGLVIIVAASSVSASIVSSSQHLPVPPAIVNPGADVSASIAWAQSQYNSPSRLPSMWWVTKLLTLVPLVALVYATFSSAFSRQVAEEGLSGKPCRLADRDVEVQVSAPAVGSLRV